MLCGHHPQIEEVPMKSVRSAALALLAAGALAQSAAACVTNADCDDLNVCTGVETCQAGVCVPGNNLVCDDANPCTTNTCNSSTGCAFLPSEGCMVAGRKIKLGSRGDLRLTVLAQPEIGGTSFPANFGPGDPVLHGATIRIFSNAGDTFDTILSMPHSNWHYMRTPGDNRGYKYKDLGHEYGPIKIALVRNGRPSKVKGGGAELGFSLNNDPNPVNVVLQLGDQQYCLSFGGIARFNPGRGFKSKRSDAPAACPFP
jgi:hypothetical protein